LGCKFSTDQHAGYKWLESVWHLLNIFDKFSKQNGQIENAIDIVGPMTYNAGGGRTDKVISQSGDPLP